MQLPFIFFGQHTRYSYAALDFLQNRGVVPQLIIIAMPKGKEPRKDPLTYYQYARGQRVEPSLLRGAYDLRPLAAKNCCDLIEVEEVNNPAVLAHIAGHRPQFFLTVGFSHLFSPNLLSLAPVGALNIHPSLLPEFRGPSPFFWIWKKGRFDAAGVTLHYMNERADRGNILGQEAIDVTKEINIFDYLETAGQKGAEIFYRFLQQGGFPAGTPQESSSGCWAPRPQFDDLTFKPAETTLEQLEYIIRGMGCGYQFHIDLGVDRYYFNEWVEGRPGATLAGQYLLKGDTLYLPLKDGLAICTVNE